MALSLSPERLRRYRDVAMLVIRHGKDPLKEPEEGILEGEPSGAKPAQGEPGDLRGPGDRSGAPKGPRGGEGENSRQEQAERFARDLEELGPTFIKLGQLLSTRAEFLSPPYLAALSRLQDNVKPFPSEEAEQIVHEELGIRISKAFKEFDREPIAAASLGQVHRAVMRDGRPVAVKVQRPGIRATVLGDLDVLEDIAESLDRHTEAGRRYAFTDMLAQFRKTILLELDYRNEAHNLRTLRENLARYTRIVIPQPIEDFSTTRVLTMEYVRGVKITAFSPLARLEVDGGVLADELFRAYLDQFLVHGFFHADPHPGNVFITEDKRIALIDLGMTARLDPELREQLLRLLLAIGEGRGREAAALSMSLWTPVEDFDKDEYIRQASSLIADYQDATMEKINVGSVMVQLTGLAAANGLRPSSELTMLGKTLMNLDEIGRTLDPTFNPNMVIRDHARDIMKNQVQGNLSPSKLFSSVLDVNEFVRKLPSRLTKVLDTVAGNEFHVRVVDETKLMDNLQKIANRITLGLVLAALIIGASLLMRVPTSFTILGYPGLAILMFLAAAAFGFALVGIILRNDELKHGRGPTSSGRPRD
ncbi:MAG TPA: AarF/UbiB family protein [Bacteroidota bacterium]